MFQKRGYIEDSDVATLDEVATIEVDGMKMLWLSFTMYNAALTGFTIEGRVHPQGQWFSLAAASGDFTTPVHPIVKASGNLTTAGTSGTHWMKMDVSGLHEVRIKAGSGSSAAFVGHYGLG